MSFQVLTQTSSGERALAVCLVAFTTFMVGYTASRVSLSQTSQQEVVPDSIVIPHQAEMWKYFGE
ncbi:MAG: hypothetical protein AAGA75_25305 [Cyanobacteria bacterium P01_E01_bin.6]